ncbi:hypothetical protein EDC65_4687 [Stella humosa]|uniref:Uncharacterized protein n=1 Tax=Stella humosa TaxID=94 RepID=A0A3N1KY79_9PROT|nr:hypothetical protein [Stella humosa]ROP83156.1 hypothetical protein EDC65_4687 [Stella humosa]BBK30067.1 hypothetical protein STHU_07010 [Stella humosa]
MDKRQLPVAALILLSAAGGVGAGTVAVASLSYLVIGGDVANLPPTLNLAAQADWLMICALPVAFICVASLGELTRERPRPVASPLPRLDWQPPLPASDLDAVSVPPRRAIRELARAA